MPNDEIKASKTLLGGAAAAGGLIVAVGVRSNRLNKVAKAKQFQANTAEELAESRRRMTPRQRARDEHAQRVQQGTSTRPVQGLKENARSAELRALREDMQARSGQKVNTAAWAEKQLNENPDAFRKGIKARRLATRAAKASRLAKGVTKKMGVLGATAGMADTIGIVNRAEAEGGAFPARLGKFAEEWLGLPPGATQRPMTDAEKKARWST